MIKCKKILAVINNLFQCIFSITENEIMSKVLQKLLSRACQRPCQNGVWRHVANIASASGGSSAETEAVDAFKLMRPRLSGLMEDIHTELESDIVVSTNIGELAK